MSRYVTIQQLLNTATELNGAFSFGDPSEKAMAARAATRLQAAAAELAEARAEAAMLRKLVRKHRIPVPRVAT